MLSRRCVCSNTKPTVAEVISITLWWIISNRVVRGTNERTRMNVVITTKLSRRAHGDTVMFQSNEKVKLDLAVDLELALELLLKLRLDSKATLS